MKIETKIPHRAKEMSRQEKLILWFCDWIADYHVPTLEHVLISLIMVLGFAVLVFSSRLIVVPPPYMVGLALILPAPVWAVLLIFGASYSLWGRALNNTLARYRGAVFSFFVASALCGPLYLKAPWMTTMLVGLLLLQSVLVRRLQQAFYDEARVHRKERSSDLV